MNCGVFVVEKLWTILSNVWTPFELGLYIFYILETMVELGLSFKNSGLDLNSEI